ncbi:Pyridoxine/pyridoxamine 5'-phosphate oxidase [Microbacterium oxydans]|uniref:Pyridoxine/pyridoxamine 5'-phosphate oxidase n=1 Tax=Microbacterium oxydans TaxID=82380 RepID=A0A0F0KFN8_9MICO|nr:pyridoxamine 5'-phosphate oxidase family protein [Microbacterium oxydans]KJL19697.1 Pyridoxine/pyridoxamine 5'-phosphate oxidase [Microbacterium oxydans]
MPTDFRSLSSDTGSWLRAQPALTGVAPSIDLSELPVDPVPLFLDWIRHAAAVGVAEPHAATLATVDGDGIPDARTLILKNVDERGWAFAGARSSRKGSQLASAPAGALNFWWQPLVRAVRVRGRVQEAGESESAADLAGRSAVARAGIAPGDWALWRLVPTRVEFWQGAADRDHTRIVYRRTEAAWDLTVAGAAAGTETTVGEREHA